MKIICLPGWETKQPIVRMVYIWWTACSTGYCARNSGIFYLKLQITFSFRGLHTLTPTRGIPGWLLWPPKPSLSGFRALPSVILMFQQSAGLPDRWHIPWCHSAAGPEWNVPSFGFLLRPFLWCWQFYSPPAETFCHRVSKVKCWLQEWRTVLISHYVRQLCVVVMCNIFSCL